MCSEVRKLSVGSLFTSSGRCGARFGNSIRNLGSSVDNTVVIFTTIKSLSRVRMPTLALTVTLLLNQLGKLLSWVEPQPRNGGISRIMRTAYRDNVLLPIVPIERERSEVRTCSFWCYNPRTKCQVSHMRTPNSRKVPDSKNLFHPPFPT